MFDGSKGLGTYYEDNGPRKGYTLFDHEDNEVETAPLRIYDKIDGEADEIFGGPIPDGWADQKVDGNRLEAQRNDYTREKYLRRALIPGTSDLWFSREAYMASDRFLLVAGPSAFPTHTSHAFTYRAPFEDSQLPNTFSIAMDWHSLFNAMTAVTSPPTAFTRQLWWRNRFQLTQPMYHIFPGNYYSWWPRRLKTWVHADRLVETFKDHQLRIDKGTFPVLSEEFLLYARNDEHSCDFRIAVTTHNNPQEYPYPPPSLNPDWKIISLESSSHRAIEYSASREMGLRVATEPPIARRE
ncbi:hypothetical protein F4777DRAFT_330618 [Nemania sp. FL0916]|nr:hypothetical protein F4777DRAFT_330618 [Nemania sp. FL0916]